MSAGVIQPSHSFELVLSFCKHSSILATTVSVKTVGTLYCLLALPMLVCKSQWDTCNKHWEERRRARSKKNSVGWKYPKYFCLCLCWRRNLRNLKQSRQILRLSCYSVADALVMCWNVYSDFANVSAAVNWVMFLFLLWYKDNRNTANFQFAKIIFLSAVLEEA